MKYQLSISCSKDELRNIRKFLEDIMQKHDVDETEANAMILAVDEVCANLIIHAHDCNPMETIDLEVTVKKGRDFTFDIIDNVKVFDISKYKEPTLNELIQARKKGGVGLILVRRIMDNIQLITRDGLSIYRLQKSFA